MFNDVTHAAPKRIFASAQQLRAQCPTSEINAFTAVAAAKVMRHTNSFLAEANHALVRSASL
jgi:hypothetical protein